MLADAQQAKRVSTVSQPSRFDPSSAAFQSLCAVHYRARGMDRSAAASLLHAAAFGLRAPLAGEQAGG